MAQVSLRRPAALQPRVMAKGKGRGRQRPFVPRVIDGGKGSYLVAREGDATGAVVVKVAGDAIEAALSFLELSTTGLETAQVSIAVTDCETGLSHCFRLHFYDETVPSS